MKGLRRSYLLSSLACLLLGVSKYHRQNQLSTNDGQSLKSQESSFKLKHGLVPSANHSDMFKTNSFEKQAGNNLSSKDVFKGDDKSKLPSQ